jgi:hypothetical protein
VRDVVAATYGANAAIAITQARQRFPFTDISAPNVTGFAVRFEIEVGQDSCNAEAGKELRTSWCVPPIETQRRVYDGRC